MRTTPMAFAAAALLACAAGAQTGSRVSFEGARARIVLETTSDWTRVRFPDEVEWTALDFAATGEGAERATAGPLFVSKEAYDESLVTVEATLLLSNLPEGTIEIEVTKGDVGETRIVLSNANREEAVEVARLVHGGKVPGDPKNPRALRVETSRLLDGGPVRIEIPPPRCEKKVLAFYYPWYGTPDGPTGRWFHWDPAARRHTSTHTPARGWYDSHDPEVVRAHATQARAAGLDGWVSSWWGPGDFTDRAFPLILAESERAGLVATVYVEAATGAADLARQLEYVLDTYGGHRAFLRIEEKPAIFVYGRVLGEIGREEIERAFAILREKGKEGFYVGDSLDPSWLEIFQGLHTYNPVFEEPRALGSTYRGTAFACRRRQALFAATVVPGYDDTFVREPGGTRGRDEGRLYDAFWEAALASRPDLVLVTSWNEWHEGSEIEPSTELGEEYLARTRRWVEEWKGSK